MVFKQMKTQQKMEEAAGGVRGGGGGGGGGVKAAVGRQKNFIFFKQSTATKVT
jgi:hypothetical protein